MLSEMQMKRPLKEGPTTGDKTTALKSTIEVLLDYSHTNNIPGTVRLWIWVLCVWSLRTVTRIGHLTWVDLMHTKPLFPRT